MKRVWSSMFALLVTSSWLFVTVSVYAATPLTFEKDIRPILKANCFDCHGEGEKLKGGLDLRSLVTQDLAKNGLVWEQVLRLVEARQMPPVGEQRLGLGARSRI